MSSSRAPPSPHNDYIDMSWLFSPDNDDNIPDNEAYFAAPAVPITLTPSAQDILKKLKTRCAWQLQSLRDEWRLDLQTLKHETIYEENDKNGVWRYAGMLIAMPEKWSKHLQGIIRNNDAKQVEKELGKLPSHAMVKFVRRLRSKPTAYVDQISHLWFLMNGKKERGHEAWTRYYTDMGLLLQTPDDQVKEIFRILVDEIKAGRIRKGEHWRMFGYIIPPAGFHIEQQDVTRETSVTVPPRSASGETASRSTDVLPPVVQESGDGSEGVVKGTGFIPRPGQWKCGRCTRWNNARDVLCTRRDRSGVYSCWGIRAIDTVVVAM